MLNLSGHLAEDHFSLVALFLVIFLGTLLFVYWIYHLVTDRREARRDNERSSLLRVDAFLDQCQEEGVIENRDEVHQRAYSIKNSFYEELHFVEDENSKPFCDRLETFRRIYIKVIPFREGGNSFSGIRV